MNARWFVSHIFTFVLFGHIDHIVIYAFLSVVLNSKGRARVRHARVRPLAANARPLAPDGDARAFPRAAHRAMMRQSAHRATAPRARERRHRAVRRDDRRGGAGVRDSTHYQKACRHARRTRALKKAGDARAFVARG